MTLEDIRPVTAARGAGAVVDPLAGYHVTIVPHTHWDREWYLPFEVFRMRLARTVEEICDVLEADPRFRSFTLDGQAVILEDIVELRPDLEPRLRRLLAEGRLVTGPAYILPDELLAGQESLVRNFLAGRAACRRFGAEPMAVGYMPDTFGHVAQLPQILRGFGLDSFIFWRGMGDEAARLGMAFEWQASDGTSVTAIRQLGSYGSACEIGRWGAGGVDLIERPDRYPDAASARLVRFVTTYAAELERTFGPAGGPNDGAERPIFLCNGSDHERIHARLPELLEHARGQHPDAAIDIGSYEDLWRRLRLALADRALPVHRGELVGGRDAPVLRGINSTRIGLKQAAERAERALLVAETLASFAVLAPAAADPYVYPRAELGRAWREHLKNLPHDSISGCSIDPVHRDMGGRWVAVGQIADRVGREAIASLAGVTEPWVHRPPDRSSVSVVNALGAARRALATIPVPEALAESPDLGAEIDGSVVAADVLDAGPAGSRIALVPVELAGFSSVDVTLVAAGPVPPRVANAARVLAADRIGNGLVTVAAHADGTVTLTDERTGRVVDGLNRFEDVADRGDEYTFCPLEFDRLRTAEPTGVIRVVRDGPLVAELEVSLVLRLPARLSDDRRSRLGAVDVPVVTRVRIVAGSDRIEFETTVDNTAEDHRLRVRFDAPNATDTATIRAEGHFGIVRRPVRPAWSGAAWTEPPALTAHTAGAVAAGDLVVFGRGLPEYEAVPTRDGLDLALTLLRCVGWLSRDDLATRPGGAGPSVATPEAQCPGRHVFAYAVAVAPAISEGDLLRASADYRTPLAVGAAGASIGGLIEVDGDVVVTTLKAAEDGDGLILRVFAPDAATFSVRVDAQVERVRLDETPEEGDGIGALRAGEIRTLRLRPTA